MAHDNKELNDMLQREQKRQEEEAQKLLDSGNRQEAELQREIAEKQRKKEETQRQGARAYILRKIKEEHLNQEKKKKEMEFKQKQARAYLEKRKELQK